MVVSQPNDTNTGFTTPVAYGIPETVSLMSSVNAFVAVTSTGKILWSRLQNDSFPAVPTAISGQPAGTVAEIASGFGESYEGDLQCLRLAGTSIVGNVYCWGDDGYSALGIDLPDDLSTATPVPGVTGVAALTTSQQATAVVLGTGAAQFWGGAYAFVDGDDPSPTAIPLLGTDNAALRTMDTAYDAYAVKTDGSLGYVYQTHATAGTGLLLAATGTTFRAAIPCDHFDVGLTMGGSVLVYAAADMGTSTTSGANADGILGITGVATAKQVYAVPGVSNATSVAAYCDDNNPMPAHACALGSGGVSCWGGNVAGESGSAVVGNTPVAATPVAVSGETFVSIATGRDFSCAAAAGGNVYCWGANDQGQLGDGSGVGSSSPVMVQGITTARGVTARVSHACAWLADGTMACWGANDSRQLGDGTFTDQLAPVVVQGPSGPLGSVMSASAGSSHTCALLTGGTVACWGSCYYGQCGTGLTGELSTPQRVQGLVTPG